MGKEMISTIEELLVLNLREKIANDRGKFIEHISTWVAYEFLTGTKYTLAHKLDPYWDHSGQLIEDKSGHELSDYLTLSDFLDEFSGNSIATYISGIGLAYERLESILQDDIDIWIHEELDDVVKTLIENNSQTLKDLTLEWNLSFEIENVEDIIQEIYFNDIICDDLVDISYRLKEEVEKMNFSFLCKKGERIARKQIETEKEEAERKRKEDEYNKIQADLAWGKVKNVYLLYHGRSMPSKFDKPLYIKYLEPVLYQMINNGLDVNITRSFGRYKSHYFSNSVCMLINRIRI
jgi:hypothetical protein